MTDDAVQGSDLDSGAPDPAPRGSGTTRPVSGSSRPTADLVPPDPDFRERVRASFGSQAFMATLGAALEQVDPGRVAIRLPARPELTQQHGYVHAGAVTSIADSACGYAAFTLMPAGSNVLSVEFKVHLLRPAAGAALVARAEVVRAGRTLSVCRADVYVVGDSEDRRNESERHVAMMTCTIMRVAG